MSKARRHPTKWDTALELVCWRVELRGGWRESIGKERVDRFLCLNGRADLDHREAARARGHMSSIATSSVKPAVRRTTFQKDDEGCGRGASRLDLARHSGEIVGMSEGQDEGDRRGR